MIHSALFRLVRELEKKFSGKHVVFIAQRRILPKPTRKANKLKQKRPISRTLVAVHTAILDDLVGLKTRVSTLTQFRTNLVPFSWSNFLMPMS